MALAADLSARGTNGRKSTASAASSNPAAETIAILRRKGFARLLIDGAAVAFDDIDPAVLRNRTVLQVIVDRLQISGDDIRQRLTDSIEMAYLEGGGAAWAVPTASPEPQPQPPAVFRTLRMPDLRDSL